MYGRGAYVWMYDALRAMYGVSEIRCIDVWMYECMDV